MPWINTQGIGTFELGAPKITTVQEIASQEEGGLVWGAVFQW